MISEDFAFYGFDETSWDRLVALFLGEDRTDAGGVLVVVVDVVVLVVVVLVVVGGAAVALMPVASWEQAETIRSAVRRPARRRPRLCAIRLPRPRRRCGLLVFCHPASLPAPVPCLPPRP